VLIVDALEGVRDQTRRHGYLLHLLGIRQIVVVINKMDRVDFSEARYRAISDEISAHLHGLGLAPAEIIPISAREGDNVATRSASLGWYRGPAVIEALDRLTPAQPLDELPLRLPVQAIYKFDDRRIVVGRIEAGRLEAGDDIVIMPSGKIAKVRSVEAWPVEAAAGPLGAGHSAGITLDRELFVERGDIIAHRAAPVGKTQRLRARIFWLHDTPLAGGQPILIRLGTAEARGSVAAIENAIDPGELSSQRGSAVARNHVGEIEIALSRPLAADIHSDNPKTGRLVIEVDGRIAGGGLVLGLDDAGRSVGTNIVPIESTLTADERAARFGHRGAVVWLTGLPASGKSTLARALERRLFERGGISVLFDGDTLRAGLNRDLGFSAPERAENIRRLAEVAAHLAHSGQIAIVAAVSPSAADRAAARQIAGRAFREIHVAASVEVCESRDPKGHYRKARAGELPAFTGTDGSYEPPLSADLTLDTSSLAVDDAVARIEELLVSTGVLTERSRSLIAAE